MQNPLLDLRSFHKKGDMFHVIRIHQAKTVFSKNSEKLSKIGIELSKEDFAWKSRKILQGSYLAMALTTKRTLISG